MTQPISNVGAGSAPQTVNSGNAAKGSMQGRSVTNVNISVNGDADVSSSCSSKALKFLSIALMIISLATILASLALGTGLLVAGTSAASFVLFTAVTTPVIATIGAKVAIAVAAVAAFIGIKQLIGSVVLLNKSNADAAESIAQAKLQAIAAQ